MTIELSEFSYFFTVKGTEGGLHSFEVEMALMGMARNEAVKSAMQGMIDNFTASLDRVFDAGILSGEKQPIMQDSPHSLSVGYEYGGSYPKTPLFGGPRNISEQITDIFGIPDPDIRGSDNPHATHSASLMFSVKRAGEALQAPRVVMKFSFDHKLNVAVFRFMQGLTGVKISDKASEKISALDRTLALDWDRKGRDHYAELKQVDRKQRNH